MRLLFPRLARSEKATPLSSMASMRFPRSSSSTSGKILYGDVSLDASVEFVLAQKLGLIDEAAAGA
jgi:hypothetical protein